MLFPTLDFLLFLLVVLTLLPLCGERHTWRKLLLCVASYVFYAQWNWLRPLNQSRAKLLREQRRCHISKPACALEGEG